MISLFSGIGGFELAGHNLGWDTVVQCEINPFCQQVLKYHYPESYLHDDIKTLNYETIKEKSRWNPSKPTIVVGGFPCQPYSLAGKRLGKKDERHLWPSMLRVIQEIQPEWVVGENVFGLINWSGGLVFEEVQADLEASGYEVQSYVLPACGVDAPHRRERIWIVAHSNNKRRSPEFGQIPRANGEISQWNENAESRNSGNGIATYTNLSGSSSSRCRIDRDGEKKGEESKQSQHESCRPCDERTSSDTESKRQSSQQTGTTKFQSSERQVLYGGSSNGYGDKWITTDPGNIKLQGGKLHRSTKGEGQIQGESRQLGGSVRNFWEDFPTEPPICGINDGLSERLSGITFSKWRNESIKSLGNAIVPQVVYEIFKAIDKYEK